MKIVALMLLGAAVIAPAFADDAAPGNAGFPTTTTAPKAQGEATSDDSYLDKVVCKTFPPPTGTMLGKRKECHTEREWRDMQNNSRNRVNDMQQKGGGYGGPSG